MYHTMTQSQVSHTEVEHSFMHTIALAHTSGMYSDIPQDRQHLTNVQFMQQLYQ